MILSPLLAARVAAAQRTIIDVPARIPGLILRYSGKRRDSLRWNGSNKITGVDDISGNGNHATLDAADISRPSTGTEKFSGENFFDNNGVGSPYLIAPIKVGSAGVPFTVAFSCFMWNPKTAIRSYFGHASGNNTSVFLETTRVSDTGGSGDYGTQIRAFVGNRELRITLADVALENFKNWSRHSFVIRARGTGNTYDVFMDGVLLGTSTAYTYTNTSSDFMHVNCRTSSGTRTNFAHGGVGEICVYDNAISDSAVAQISNYFENDWGTNGKFWLVRADGESNMVGWELNAAINLALDSTTARIKQWSYDGSQSTPNANAGATSGLLPVPNSGGSLDPQPYPYWPYHAPSSAAIWGVSPAVHFCKQLLALGIAPKRVMVVLLPHARGGSTLVLSPARWGVPSGSHFVISEANYAAAKAALPNVERQIILWNQGINDLVGDAVTETQYDTAEKALFDAYTKDVETIIISSGWPAELIAADPTDYRQPIIAKKAAQVLEYDKAFWVPGLAGYRLDSAVYPDYYTTHFNAAGARLHGEFWAKAVNYALGLTAGVPTAPGAPVVAGGNISFSAPDSMAHAYEILARKAGTGDSFVVVKTWFPTAPYNPGDTLTTSLPTFTEDKDVIVRGISRAGEGAVSTSAEAPGGYGTPLFDLDFASAALTTISGTSRMRVPSTGSNSTPWDSPATANNPTVTTVEGQAALATTASQRVLGPAIPLGAYTKVVLFKLDNTSNLGNALSDRGVVSTGYHTLWRNAGTTLRAGHIGAGGTGSASSASASGVVLEASKWYCAIVTHDPALGSNNIKLYINGTLAVQATAPEREFVGGGTWLNGYIDSNAAGNNGVYRIARVYGTALDGSTVAALTAQLATETGLTLG